MSHQATSWAIKQRAGNPARKMILMCLANYADENGKCFPSQRLIAEEAEVSVRTVRDGIKALETLGLVGRDQRRRADGTKTTDLFKLPIQAAESAGSHGIKRQSTPIKRQNLPDKEPVTEPITKERNLGMKFRSLSESLVPVIKAAAQNGRGHQRRTA